ncbi:MULTISPECIES: SDR family NAD(P)-dependent oxidoreductase [Brenneria]|nr:MULTISPECIES: SDR family NAD(P)-dependent oxidoreductase [Brenneria]EHD22166.1 protein of unknown function DUF336 [Brenneria sp. EniD312]
MSIQGKTIAIIGGSSGFGRRVAQQAHEAGAQHLILGGRDAQRLQQAKDELSALGAKVTIQEVDAHNETSLRGFFDSLPRFDHLVALEKVDGAIGISPAVAQAKARTAALLQSPSKDFEDFINSGRPSFLSTPGVTPLEGGVPISVDGQVVGAVGVSGAHGANDSQVAKAAAAAVDR